MKKLSEQLQYLTSDAVGKVIYEGLSAVYEAQPQYPVNFLATWLLNYTQNEKNKKREEEAEMIRQDLIAKHEHEKKSLLEAKAKELEAQELQKKIEADFKQKIQGHLYHEELLDQEFPEFVKETLGIPAAYIGYLGYPLKEIEEGDEDPNAHLDMTQEKLIRYVGASKGQRFMIGRTLLPETGVTYEVLKPKEEEAEGGEEGDGGEEGVVKGPKPNYLYVADVTKEPRIVYFKIPKLGSYIACSLTYKSVLKNEAAFDEAVKERQKVMAEKEEQEKEKNEKLAEYQQKLEDAQDEGLDTKELEEEWNNREWEEIVEKEFESIPQEFVLCADTLGEDREIPEEQRAYFEDLAKFFVKCWEESEKKQFSNDIDLQLKYLKEFNKEEYMDDFNNRIDDEVAERMQETEEPEEGEPSEVKVEYRRNVARAETFKKTLLEDEIKGYLIALKDYRSIKFPNVFQIALIMIGFTKQEINLPKTNILDWKKMKHYISNPEFFERLSNYQYRGPKSQKVMPYARPAQILKRLEGIPIEEVDDYNIGLGLLYRYMKQVLEARLQDVTVRKLDKQEQRAKREQLIVEEQERQQRKAEAWEEAKTQKLQELEQEQAQDKEEEEDEGEEGEGEGEGVEGEGESKEKPTFNMEEWQAEWEKQWDEENPPKEIPPEVEDDVDEDMEPEATETE